MCVSGRPGHPLTPSAVACWQKYNVAVLLYVHRDRIKDCQGTGSPGRPPRLSFTQLLSCVWPAECKCINLSASADAKPARTHINNSLAVCNLLGPCTQIKAASSGMHWRDPQTPSVCVLHREWSKRLTSIQLAHRHTSTTEARAVRVQSAIHLPTASSLNDTDTY